MAAFSKIVRQGSQKTAVECANVQNLQARAGLAAKLFRQEPLGASLERAFFPAGRGKSLVKSGKGLVVRSRQSESEMALAAAIQAPSGRLSADGFFKFAAKQCAGGAAGSPID